MRARLQVLCQDSHILLECQALGLGCKKRPWISLFVGFVFRSHWHQAFNFGDDMARPTIMNRPWFALFGCGLVEVHDCFVGLHEYPLREFLTKFTPLGDGKRSYLITINDPINTTPKPTTFLGVIPSPKNNPDRRRVRLGYVPARIVVMPAGPFWRAKK